MMSIALESSDQLNGKRIFIVENEALIAMKIEMMVIDAGGSVIGPCSTLRKADNTVETEEFDAAILDVNLGKHEVYPIAVKLVERGIRFVFYSAHAKASDIENMFPDARLIAKPASERIIIQALIECVAAN